MHIIQNILKNKTFPMSFLCYKFKIREKRGVKGVGVGGGRRGLKLENAAFPESLETNSLESTQGLV